MKKMIDCNITKNYLSERNRMCKRKGCNECSLGSYLNGTNKNCRVFENCYPDKAIEIVQKWSNENSPQTLLTEFLKHYPQTDLENGLPPLCAEMLGLVDKECRHEFNACYCDCQECWNTFINEESEGIK